jgi:hypothetical protein
MTGQPGPDSKNRKARAQDCKDKMSYIYRPGQDRTDRTGRTGQESQHRQPGKNSQERTVGTGKTLKNSQDSQPRNDS